MEELPEGWVRISLGELAKEGKHTVGIGPFGSNLKVSDYETSGVPLVFVREIRAEKFGGPTTKFVSLEKAEELRPHQVIPGDLLITKMGEPPGDTAIYPRDRPPGVITADCIRLRVADELSSARFLRLWLRARGIRDQFVARTQGVAQQKLSLARFKDVEIPLPPLAEQKRIVEKVEVLLARVESARGRLACSQEILKRFRQSVLAAACGGRLAAGTPNSDLRCSWPIRSLSELLSEPMANGRSVPDADRGFPVLRLTALRGGSIDLSQRKIGAWTSTQAHRFLVKRDDFLVGRGNGSLALVGRGGLVLDEPDPVAYPDTLIRIRVDKRLMSSSFLRLVWDAVQTRSQIETAAHTTAGIHKVSQKDLAAIKLPCPGLSDQEETVRRAGLLLSLAALVEERLASPVRSAALAFQAILAKAYGGELVPTEAELARAAGHGYESGDELLTKLQLERPSTLTSSVRRLPVASAKAKGSR